MPRVSVRVPDPGDPRHRRDPRLDLETVERLVDEHAALGLEPGLAYGVVDQGRLVHDGGRGVRRHGGGDDVPGATTAFRIASMTKSFTAASVLLLRDEGRLRLDDEVTRFLPEVAALRPPTDDSPPLTVRMLLTMTAGFPTDDPWGDRQQDLPDEDFVGLLSRGLSFAWPPGVIFEYSNLGYALLGRVITAAAGEPYADVVRRRLLEPLGLTSTGFLAPDGPDAAGEPDLATGHRRGRDGWEIVPFAGYGAFAPMGGLFSTVTDLARWVGGMADAFPPRDGEPAEEHPLRRGSRRELQLPQLGLPPSVTWRSLSEPPTVRGMAYGFGLMVENDPRLGTLVSHSGGYPGFGSHMRWHPASGLGVVVLGNATYTPVSRLGAKIMDALLSEWRPGAGPAGPCHGPEPATGSMREKMAAVRRAVERLLTNWDDALALELFSMNVDLDEPIPQRRARVEAILHTLGPLSADGEAPPTSVSPAHCAWWMRGPYGRLRIEIRLSPELPPRVQTLTLTPVPEPPLHRRVAQELAAMLGDRMPRWPDNLALAAPLDLEEADRRIRVAAAWAGESAVEDIVASDGGHEATFRLVGERADLLLTIAIGSATAAVEKVLFTPATP